MTLNYLKLNVTNFKTFNFPILSVTNFMTLNFYKLSVTKFVTLKEHMKETYERRAVEIKDSLLEMFKIEYAKLHDIYLQNRKLCDRLIDTEKPMI